MRLLYGVLQRDGFSQFNRVYEFPYTLNGQPCDMMMTSVSGHLMQLEFSAGTYPTLSTPFDEFA
jgi:hypothetical protein